MVKTIAELLAAEAKQLQYRDIPPEIVHEVKRSMLDTVGCILAGYASEPSRMMQGMIDDMAGASESTVFGSGVQTSCLNATLANGVMLRHYDYAGVGHLDKQGRDTSGHHCEAFPSILAVGERQHSNGQEVITAFVLAYELMSKVFASVPDYDKVLDECGFVHETMRTPCIMALIIGRLIGLEEKQMAYALALGGCFNLELGMLNWCEEEMTMARNLRFPFGAYNGILSAFLARKGYKAPLNVFEGRLGLAEVVTGGKMEFEKLRQPRNGWTVQNQWIKSVCVCGYLQGSTEATITLVTQHDIKPDDVAAINIRTTPHSCKIAANKETRLHPDTMFTADHSAYYCTAVAVVDRECGPDQFTDEKLRDPMVAKLAEKITMEPDPALDEYHSPAIVTITTRGGQKHECKVLYPKGHPMNPMTDAEVERKFRSQARKAINETQMGRIIDAVYTLDKVDDISQLVKLFVSQQRQ